MDQLVVLHHKKSEKSQDFQGFPLAGISWETCLRNIWIGTSSHYKTKSGFCGANVQVYHEAKAYGFLLEVICGLHSPVFGETEVLGQFRQLVTSENLCNLHHSFYQNLFENLLKDAKDIRHRFIKGLGCQSYGSMTRKLLPEGKSLSIIGGGKLVQEILPWVSPHFQQITIHTRTHQEWMNKAQEKTPFQWKAIEDFCEGSDSPLIVAAPMGSKDFKGALGCRFLIDFRSESTVDPLHFQGMKSWVLDDFFQAFQLQNMKFEKVRRQIDLEIAACVERYFERQWIRPNGWDDLCG